MSKKQEKKSLDWLVASPTLLGSDPLVAVMKQRGIPLTRENWLKLAYPEGAPDPMPAEALAEIPPELS